MGEVSGVHGVVVTNVGSLVVYGADVVGAELLTSSGRGVVVREGGNFFEKRIWRRMGFCFFYCLAYVLAA